MNFCWEDIRSIYLVDTGKNEKKEKNDLLVSLMSLILTKSQKEPRFLCIDRIAKKQEKRILLYFRLYFPLLVSVNRKKNAIVVMKPIF